MIKVENIKISGFESAFRGLRNPMNSWDKSDSLFIIGDKDTIMKNAFDLIIEDQAEEKTLEKIDEEIEWYLKNGTQDSLQPIQSAATDYGKEGIYYAAFLGKNDLNLAKRMVLAGNDEAKFTRQIFVSMDITAPLTWWKECDQYKVGTTTNSCSTMHKLASTPITKECFSFDCGIDGDAKFHLMTEELIKNLEELRNYYNKTKDVNYWRALVMLLPEGWNQKRTWTANYQVLRNIYFARRNHKLTEWHEFCNHIEYLPYASELITIQKENISDAIN